MTTLPAAGATPGKPAKRPNILLIVTDQQRPDFIGALGRVPVRTPNLDRLCREGTTFTRAYTPCPVCTPARATMVTGQYPSRHGAWSIGTELDDDAVSLPAMLGEAGYATGIIGKSHLKPVLREGSLEAPPRSKDWDFFRSWTGPWYGFEYAKINCGHVNEPHAYCMHYGLFLHEMGIPCEPPYFGMKGGNQVDKDWALPEEAHQSTWVANETIAYLDRHVQQGGDRPFYLYVNIPDPHRPFRAPAPWGHMHDGAELPPPKRTHAELERATSLHKATVDGSLMDKGWHDHVRPPAQSPSPAGDSEPWSEQEREIWEVSMGMTSLLDKHVGRILDHLDATGLAQDTLVVFTTDHGDYLGDHWISAKGGSHYDSAVRLPFLVRWPGRVSAGLQNPALQSLVDLPTTFLRAAGVDPDPSMQGTDQLPCWTGEAASRREGVWIDHRVERGLYVGSWITPQHRLSVHHLMDEGRNEFELYDLEADPDELKNLATEHGATRTVAGLMADMMRYRQSVSGPWQSRPTFA